MYDHVCNWRSLAAVGLAFCKDLQELRLDGNMLSQLNSLAHLPQLTLLDLSQNRLSSLDGLTGCPALTDLIASRNRLSSLQACYGLSLEHVDLSSNHLTDIGGTFTVILTHALSIDENVLSHALIWPDL